MEIATNITSSVENREVNVGRRPLKMLSELNSRGLLGMVDAFCPCEIHSLSKEATIVHLNNIVGIFRKLVKENPVLIPPYRRDLSITSLFPVNREENLYIASGLINQLFKKVVNDIYPLAIVELSKNNPSMGDIYNLLERKNLSEIIKDVEQELDHSSKIVAEALRGAPNHLPIPQGTTNEIRSWFGSPNNRAHLREVVTLDLTGKRLKTIPYEIRFLPHLETLNLNNNLLTCLPEEFYFIMIHLKTLNLSNNRLTGLSENIGDIRNIVRLDLSHNQLITLPKRINSLWHLNILNLSHNQLTTLPEEIGESDEFMRDLEDLKKLDLRDNQLTTLPKSLTKLHDCDEIRLENNKILLGNLSPQLQDFLKGLEIDLDELQSSQRIDVPEEGGGGGGKK